MVSELGWGWQECVLDDLRRNDLARTAPGGKAVEDHQTLLAEGGVEVGLPVHVCQFSAGS